MSGFSSNPLASKIVTATYNLATVSGTQIISGIGFRPSALLGFGCVNGAPINTYQTYSGLCDSGLNQSCTAAYQSQPWISPAGPAFFFASDAGASNWVNGVITAIGDGTITIAWTKTGAPAGTFAMSFLCFK